MCSILVHTNNTKKNTGVVTKKFLLKFNVNVKDNTTK